MELLLQTCTDWKMEKVMLTYFKGERFIACERRSAETDPIFAANRTALRFYQRLGSAHSLSSL